MTIPQNLDQSECYELLAKLTEQAKDVHSRCVTSGKFIGTIPAASGDTIFDVCRLANFVDQARMLLGEAATSDQLAQQAVRPVPAPKARRPLNATERTLLAISEAEGGEADYVAGLLSDDKLTWTERCRLANEFRDRKRRAAAPQPTTVFAGKALTWTEQVLAAKGLPLDTKLTFHT